MKWRFMAAIMAIILLVLLAQDVPLAIYLQNSEYSKTVTGLERDAFVLAGRSQAALWTAEPAEVEALSSVSRDYRDAGGGRVVITDKDGVAIVTSDDDQASVGSSYSTRPEIETALSGSVTTGERYSNTLNEELMYVAVPILNGNDVIGSVRITFPTATVDNAVNGQLRILGIVALTTVILAGITGYILSISVTRRLRLLEAVTEKLAEGELDARADDSAGAPELRKLAQSFNLMGARLSGLVEQQRRFAADASHQLRTPLTALRLRLERARELLASDPAAAEERLLAVENEAERLSNIIEGLLALSRTESSSAAIEAYDLSLLARERIEQWQPLAAESNVKLRFEGPVSARVNAVPTAVEQILDNYLDNALTVSPPNSKITVRIVPGGTLTALHVLDEGPGLSKEDCSRAFDRFWRATSDSSGSGLGLAIVQQLALASGATAKLSPRPEGGLDAAVRFSSAI